MRKQGRKARLEHQRNENPVGMILFYFRDTHLAESKYTCSWSTHLEVKNPIYTYIHAEGKNAIRDIHACRMSTPEAVYNSFFNLFASVSSFLNSLTPVAGLPSTAFSPPNVLNAL